MTQQEQMLLEIAKDIIELNSWCDAALTGSLMLKHRGIETGRDARDIDIIVEELDEEDSPTVPSGFELVDTAGSKSELEAIQYKNEEGVKVDFLFSEELREIHGGIVCGSLKCLIEAKSGYAKTDIGESRQKHEFDLKQIGDL
ncbi:hypothetical protein [Geofilum rhodophaeum]|uniref:hypothetical protein n=1 Tax=Geofilum rhodophaeum TaxID=1965019 RepID=UPI000B5225A3|nr:hypothetical protein [Geofilum rhodophaeum]